MRLRAMMLAVLSLGLHACAPEAASSPVPSPIHPAPSSTPNPASAGGPAQAGPGGRAEATDGFIVVRKPGAVSVLARVDGKPLWSVPQRAGDPITKARLAQGSIVVVRRSQTAEVYDLRTGTLRFSKEGAGAIGVSWTMLYADSAACQPDCQLRAYDLATGAQRWVGPKSLPGKVMAETGEPPDGKYDPAGEFEGPLRAHDNNVIAVRTAEAVLFLDAASGQELARLPVPQAGIALGSDRILVEWTAVKDCQVTVDGRDSGTGEVVWQVVVGTRPLGQQSACQGGWRPDIADGAIALSDPRAQGKLIEVDTGRFVWTANPFGDPAVAVTRPVVLTLAQGRLTALRPDPANPSWTTRLWAAEMSEESRVTGLALHFDRLLYTTEYEGSTSGIGWVRDLATGRRLWYADGVRPLGVDGDRVIAETPSGEIRLERMVSTG